MTRWASASLFARQISSRSVTQFLTFLFCSAIVLAQAPQPGTPTFSPIEDHGYYSIDLQDLHINVNVPIRRKAGLGIYALYGSSLTYVNSVSIWTVTEPLTLSSGVLGNVDLLGYSLTASTYTKITCGTHTNETLFQNLYIIDNEGTTHNLPATLSVDQFGCYNGGTGTTTDNSGLTAVVSSTGTGYGQYQIYSSSGNHTESGLLINSGGSLYSYDADGNVKTISYIGTSSSWNLIDTLSTTAVTFSPNTTSTSYTYLDASGNTVSSIETTTQLNTKDRMGLRLFWY